MARWKWKERSKVRKLKPMERLFGYGIIRTAKSIDYMTDKQYKRR